MLEPLVVVREVLEAVAVRRLRAAGLGSEEAVRFAQKMQVGPWIPMEIQLQRAEVGPTSGPTWRRSRLRRPAVLVRAAVVPRRGR